MKTNRIFCTIFLAFCVLSPSFAQEENKREKKEDDKRTKTQNESLKVFDVAMTSSTPGAVKNHNVIPLIDLRYEGMKGSYYFNTDWLRGDMFDAKGGYLRKDVPLKYDAVNQELVMKKPDGDSAAVYPSDFKLYHKETTYHFVKYPPIKYMNGALPNSYLLQLHKGKNLLLKQVSKHILKADYKGAYSDNRPYDSFEDNSVYFFVRDNQQIEVVKLKKAAVLALLKDKKKELEAYIKENDINFDNDFALAEVFAYYEKLH